jgi:protein TonB
MITLLEGGEQLERELTPEPLAAPAAGSLLLHGALAASLLAYGLLGGLFHHNQWGGAGSGGAIQVTLTSALPLPSDQPPNENVLATDTPSQAPAETDSKTKEAVDESALAITGKQKSQQQNARKTPDKQPQRDNRARYGEQAGSSMARATQAQNAYSDGPVSLTNGDFGNRFGWYVEIIKHKVAQNWFRAEVDPRTPRGASAQIYFKVSRQGAPANFRINISSGSPTLDSSCLRATQRVDTFGALPTDSNDQWLEVTYDCGY